MDHSGGGLIFEAGPGFRVIRKGNLGTLAGAVIAYDQGGFVVQRISALHGIVIVKLTLVIELPDGF